MSSGRLELKVGLFVVVLLGLAAIMSIKFSKTGFGLSDTFSIKLKTKDAGSVIKNSPVLMSGVKVGYVDKISLDLNGSVTLIVELFSEYADNIDANATFEIKSVGFLGDQYVGVFPPPERTMPLQNGAEKPCKSPFDIMAVGRDFQGLILSVSNRVYDLNETIVRINEGILSTNTLSAFTNSVGVLSQKIEQLADLNATKVSNDVANGIERFNSVMGELDKLASGLSDFNSTKVSKDATDGIGKFNSSMEDLQNLTNGLSDFNSTKVFKDVTDGIGKFNSTMEDLQNLTNGLSDFNSTKASKDVAGAVQHFSVAARKLGDIAGRLDSGKGIAGSLLKDEEMRMQFQLLVSNLNTTAAGLTNIVKQINKRGIFYKPKPESLVIPPRSVRPK
ncbi:MAG: MlaD family protein [Verrucomicrobiota bacterium]|nr:MlaD family protein [Verrucomicrobiota bacterium]